MRSRSVSTSAHRSGPKEAALFILDALQAGAVDDLRNLFTAENANDVIDFRNFFEEIVALSFGEAASHDHRANAALTLEIEHLADDAEGFLASRFNKAAGIDNHHIGAVCVGRERIAVLRELAQHSLGIDEVLRTTEADEGEPTLRRCASASV